MGQNNTIGGFHQNETGFEVKRIGIIGLGYVGLPLAVEFGRYFPTLGFDINVRRIEELDKGSDSTREVSSAELQAAKRLELTSRLDDLRACNVYIVTAPTPIDKHKNPDLGPLIAVCNSVGSVLSQRDIVIFESTVYPGATEEVCAPVLEHTSGLELNDGFFIGYSPERVNPGDQSHRLNSIVKITSGSTPEAADFVDWLYRKIITAGTHKTRNIRTAEAAKVIENTQRDVNIALINELALIFHKLNIDTLEVLEAAGTKWNFLPFRPGLVGGHCIGVDPYYLTQKAQEIGYHPEVVLAGRRINDGMGAYIAERVIRLMTQRRIHVVDARILILGFTFKENCPDTRNTRVIDIVHEFEGFHAKVDVHDPWIDTEETQKEYSVNFVPELAANGYDAIILAVAHRQFVEIGSKDLRALGKPQAVLFDVKSILPAGEADERL